jgi:hypothetical protein
MINSSLSQANEREQFSYTPSVMLGKSFNRSDEGAWKSLHIQFRVLNDFQSERNRSTQAKRNLDRSFQFFRFEGNLGMQHHIQNRYQYHLGLNYGKSYDYPEVDQLFTLVDDINVYDIRVGNPRLRNIVHHRMNLNAGFNTQNPNSLYVWNGGIGGSYNRSLHPVTDSVINDPSGKRTAYLVNADRSRTLGLNVNMNISRRFRKNNLQLMYNVMHQSGTVPNYLDGLYNTSETVNTFHQVTLQFSLKSLLVLKLEQSIQQFRAKQQAAGLRSFTNHTNSTKLGVVLNHPERLSFSSTVDLVDNAAAGKPFVLWNAFASYRFLKQQGELKASAMDVLKQYRNISAGADAFGTTTQITNGLQQYFLLTFAYYPRRFGKTELRRREPAY